MEQDFPRKIRSDVGAGALDFSLPVAEKGKVATTALRLAVTLFFRFFVVSIRERICKLKLSLGIPCGILS